MTIPATGESHREAQRDYRAQLSKLWWAGSIVNGAGLIGLLQLIGNVDDPDYAFTALQWPMALMGMGLGIGLMAITAGLISNLQSMNVGQAEDHAVAYGQQIANSNEIRTKLKEANNPTLDLFSVPKIDELITDLRARQVAQGDLWLGAQRKEFLAGNRALKLSNVSCLFFGVALALAIGSHSIGFRIQPLKPPTVAVRQSATPAPAAVPKVAQVTPPPDKLHGDEKPASGNQ